jgi:hypothetical protein
MKPGRVLQGVLLYFVIANSGTTAIAEDAGCLANVWTKPISGLWEEPFWSCGRLPATRDRIAFTNAGSKSLEIGATTTANFLNTLSLFSLRVDAPAESSNQLLLNNAGTNVPLDVLLLILGTNGSLASHSSAVKAHDLDIYGSALVGDSSRLTINRIRLWGSLLLSNAYSTVSFFPVHPNGAVTHFGGVSEFPLTVMDGGSTFVLESGNVSMRSLFLKFPIDTRYGTSVPGVARFIQNGGELSADGIMFGTPNSDHRGEFILNGGFLRCQQAGFMRGTFTQTGGTNDTTVMIMPVQSGVVGRYSLAAGTLRSSNLTLGMHGSDWRTDRRLGDFVQSGGIHDAGSISLNGYTTHAGRTMDQTAVHLGFYSLTGGTLTSRSLSVGGGFTQNGGTNRARSLGVSGGGRYLLSGGELATSSTFVGGFRAGAYSCSTGGGFTHNGGAHSIKSDLTIGSYGTYRFEAGILAARNIAVGPRASLRCGSGVISNSGTFTMNGGTFVPGSGAHDLGKLVLLGEQDMTWPCPAPTNSLVLDGSSNATDVRFSRSSHMSWSGSGLRVLGWQQSAGSPRVFFGTNPRGLSAAQLSKIVFVNPTGWPSGEYPARILTTGEIVPVMAPRLAAAKASSGLALSWPEGYDLFRATNIAGPFVKVDDAANPDLFSAPNSSSSFACARSRRQGRLYRPRIGSARKHPLSRALRQCIDGRLYYDRAANPLLPLRVRPGGAAGGQDCRLAKIVRFAGFIRGRR